MRPVLYATDLTLEIKKMHKEGRQELGAKTGWPELDQHMRPAKGLLTIASGYPSSGKSEFVDAICMNLGILHGWRTLYFSPENYPISEHARKIMERYIGKELSNMTHAQINEGLRWMQDHIAFIDMPEDSYGLDAILDIAREEHEQCPFDVLVLDPWNEVSQFNGAREDLWLSAQITKLKKFLRHNDIHGIVVAHPTKPHEKIKDEFGRMDYPVPKLYDIAGGATWRNKAEYGWVVHRYPTDNCMKLSIQKIKQKNIGKIGELKFDYHFESGRFKTEWQPDYKLPVAPTPDEEPEPF